MSRIIFDSDEYDDRVGNMNDEKQDGFLEDVTDVADEHDYVVKRIEVVDKLY